MVNLITVLIDGNSHQVSKVAKLQKTWKKIANMQSKSAEMHFLTLMVILCQLISYVFVTLKRPTFKSH